MAQPITWRNVNGPSPAEASRPLELARQTLVGSLDAVGGILANQERVQNRNMLALDEAAKQSYLDQLAGAKTPEELAALQASGALDAARQGLSVQARAAIRGADEARNTALRQGVTAANTFNDSERDRTEAPIRDQIASLTAAGDHAGAKALLDRHNLRNEAALYTGVTAGERAKVVQGREDATYAHGVKARDISLETSELNLRETKRAADEAARQRGLDAMATSYTEAYQGSTGAMREAVDSALAQMDGAESLPRSDDGRLAFNRIPAEQRKVVNQYLKAYGAPSLEEAESNDTEAKAQAVASLRKAGATPADLARLDAGLTAGLSTTPVAPIGREAANIDRNQRIREANAAANSLQYVPMSMPGAVKGTMDAMFAAVDARIPKGWENENWKEELVKLTKEGIIAKDADGKPIKDAEGQPIRVLPGPEAITQIINTRRDFIGWGAADLRKSIKQWRDDPQTSIAAGKAIEDQLLNRFRQVDIPKPQGK